MKKKLLITIAVIMGGVIAVVIAQTDAELNQMFDDGLFQNAPMPDARYSDDPEVPIQRAEKIVGQYLLEERRAKQEGRTHPDIEEFRQGK